MTATAPGAPTMLVRAKFLRAHGLVPIPLDHPAAPIATKADQVGKVPAVKWEPYQQAMPDEATLTAWFGNGTPRNLGIVTGMISGVVVVDLDDPAAMAWAATHLPATPRRTRTGKGEHWFYRHPGIAVPNRARIRPGVDIRADGGYVVSPGSLHANGARYEAIGNWGDPLDVLPVFDLAWLHSDPRPAPPRARPASAPPIPPTEAQTRAAAYARTIEPAIEGQGGDHATYRVAAVLVHDFALDDDAAFTILQDYNARAVPPWTDDELWDKLRNARKYGTHGTGAKLDDPLRAPRSPAPTSSPQTFALTDSGNAEYFAHHAGQHLRFDHRRQRWLVWAGHRWQPDADAAVRRLAKQAIRQRLQEAARLADADARAKASKWALSSEARGRLEALLYLAQAEAPIADTGVDWDANPWLLGVPNGVVDLRTGHLRAGRPDDRITRHAGVAFDPDAEAPRWCRFLSEIFGGDTAMGDYVQKLAGYSLTGQTGEQIVVMGHGTGANGKGTLLNLLIAVAGDYGAVMPFSTIELHQRSVIPNDLAALDGARLVTASETQDGTRLNESRIKALTGCDPLTARFLHAEFFTFRPVAKFWLAVNHQPIVRDDSYGFWRRMRLLPFTQTFAVDGTLEGTLRAELPGILAWAVRGALAWQAEGLTPPTAVLDATATYEQDSDVLGTFLDESTERDPLAEVRAADLYQHYKSWADRHGLAERERLTANAFGRKLAERFTKVRTRAGAVYLGLSRRLPVTDSSQ
jgi:putative DNA primase/helicase